MTPGSHQLGYTCAPSTSTMLPASRSTVPQTQACGRTSCQRGTEPKAAWGDSGSGIAGLR